jgi:hypothetical protein
VGRPITETPEQRFWKHVNKDGPVPEHAKELGKCWVWTGCTIAGYGQLRINKRNEPAHRFSYSTHCGVVGELWVLHKCDNPRCVNPSHLFLGDHTANTSDKMAKKRHRGPRGERCAQHILTAGAVQQIRFRYATTSDTLASIASAHGVRRGAIKDIVRGVNWKHLPWPDGVKQLAQERSRNTQKKLGKLCA